MRVLGACQSGVKPAKPLPWTEQTPFDEKNSDRDNDTHSFVSLALLSALHLA